jgi:hypothetical protein
MSVAWYTVEMNVVGFAYGFGVSGLYCGVVLHGMAPVRSRCKREMARSARPREREK